MIWIPTVDWFGTIRQRRELTSRTNQSRAATRNSFDSAGDFLSQIDRERNGVPTSEAEALRRAMALSVEQYAPLLGMKPAAYKRRRARRVRIDGAPGYAISDLENLLRKIDRLVSPDIGRFDSVRWFAGWIEGPQPALGGLTPAELLDTPVGRQMVGRLLGAMGSGAYL